MTEIAAMNRTTSRIPPDNVSAAWQDMKSWVEGTLPQLALAGGLPDTSSNVDGLDGACYALNDPGSSDWQGDGDAVVALSGTRISAMSGVLLQPAISADSSTIHLPLSFAKLEVTGDYFYQQPCACYDGGKKVSSVTATGGGNITEAISAGSLYYVANLGDKLTLNGVVVDGDPAVTINPAGPGGLPDWLEELVVYFSAADEARTLRSELQSMFTMADFTQTMMALINQKIGG